MKRRSRSGLSHWIKISIAAFLLLFVINLGLPAFFLLLQVPSFAVERGEFWILRWQNNSTGSSFEFNLISLLIIAIAIGCIGYFAKNRRKWDA